MGGHTLSFLRPFHSVGPWGALLSRSPCVPRRTGAAVGDRGTGPRKAGCPASPEPPVGGHTAWPQTALRRPPAGSTWVPGLHRALRTPDTHGQVLCLVASREQWPCSHFMVTVTDFSFVRQVGSMGSRCVDASPGATSFPVVGAPFWSAGGCGQHRGPRRPQREPPSPQGDPSTPPPSLAFGCLVLPTALGDHAFFSSQ